jgi:hypothetical protein
MCGPLAELLIYRVGNRIELESQACRFAKVARVTRRSLGHSCRLQNGAAHCYALVM